MVMQTMLCSVGFLHVDELKSFGDSIFTDKSLRPTIYLINLYTNIDIDSMMRH